MELYQTENHYILLEGDYSLWCSRIRGTLEAKKGIYIEFPANLLTALSVSNTDSILLLLLLLLQQLLLHISLEIVTSKLRVYIFQCQLIISSIMLALDN